MPLALLRLVGRNQHKQVVNMPEDQADQTDVTKEAVNAVPSSDESSTEGNRDTAADATQANTEEQSAKQPERTVSLKVHISERTKLKDEIRDLKAAAKQREDQPGRVDAPSVDAQAPRLEDPNIDYDTNKLAAETAKTEVNKAISQERQRVANETIQTELGKMTAQFDQNSAQLAADVPEYGELIEANGQNGHGDADIEAAILESSVGADLEYYMLANPGEVARIAALPERAKQRELGKAEDKAVAFVSEQKKKGISNSTTKAPRPIETTPAGGGSSTSDVRYNEDVSFADFRARANQR